METNNLYDYASFVVNTGSTDYDVKALQSALWSNVSSAGMCRITFNFAISIKFNTTGMPAIVLTTSESGLRAGNSDYYEIPMAYIDNIYITNASGSNATIGILLVWPEMINK